jgi:hypothetical protein
MIAARSWPPPVTDRRPRDPEPARDLAVADPGRDQRLRRLVDIRSMNEHKFACPVDRTAFYVKSDRI